MFETLMKPGSYRVDYFNEKVARTGAAFGFYVCGEVEPQAVLSQSVRRNLLAGLSVIQQELGPQNLVAIYLDVNEPGSNYLLAYQQLIHDLHAGLFRRLFIFRSCMLMRVKDMLSDLAQLAYEIDGFELITYDSGACRKIPLDELFTSFIHEEERSMQ
jgi:hypothetical protein